jgi:predicted MFS family arabinose efflux permease
MLGALSFTALIYLKASPSQMGLLAAAASLPVLLLSLAAGVWVDRMPRRLVMVAADAGRFVLLATVPIAALAGGLGMAQLYAVAFGAGVLDVLFSIASRSLVPELVTPDRLLEANSSLQMSESVAETVSPAVGGSLVQALGGPATVLFDALTFLASGLLIGRIKAPKLAARPAGASPLSEAVDGVRFVLGQPVLRAILLMVTSYSFFGGFFVALYGVLAIRELGFSALGLGLLTAAGGVGSLAGARLVSPASRRFGVGRSIIGSYVLAAGAAFTMPLAGGPAWLAFGLLLFDQVVGDALWVVNNVTDTSLRQALTPAAQMGRVNATFLLASQGLRPLGAIVAGLAAEAIGVRQALFIAVAGINLQVLWLIFSPLPRVRTVEGLG